ncbi:MAG: prepilin-type N-terminal cleavage/methylation domain-containing protein [Kiritimatiellales bacterium]|nr:prepilin-type N-terminal cleavage/methylation domain-containing protein [Kiritimatiellales bacterium]
MNRRESKQGFTLLEVLVAITILALMALMLSRIFSESTRAVERGKDQALLDETARLLLDYFEQDVSQALIRTNVAFRVHLLDGNDALYFISTAVRRQLETIPRDTAPMRWQATRSADWNWSVSIWSPDNASGTKDSTRQNLIFDSDYYFTDPTDRSADFIPVHDGPAMVTFPGEYTQPLSGTSGMESHAVLAFMDIAINGDRNSNNSTDGQPTPDDMPRFVDVAIGLVSSKDMEQAMRLSNAGEQSRAENHIENNERIYTRRIFMRNIGTGQLPL